MRSVLAVAAIYGATAVLTTWPLAIVMPHRIAGDTGDTLFNCWALLWTSGQVLRALHGDLAALAQYWNGNIFHPAPLTLAYSEHLTPQMLLALPIIAATGNIVLAYNVVFLSTIVLSGVGMYLLVRELTGQPAAAFLAGLAFAFAPYRVAQYAHIEVLSSQWMPFALYGFRRFFVTRRLRPLVGGAAALVAQALSCGYYLAYFPPFAVACCLFEMAARRKLADAGSWRMLIATGTAALLLVALFLWPYVRARRTGDVGVRGLNEIESFSADTHAFATVSANARVWGTSIRALPREQGDGFPGFTILAFAVVAVVVAVRRAAARSSETTRPLAGARRRLAVLLTSTLILVCCLLAEVMLTGRGTHWIGGLRVHYGPWRLLPEIAALVTALAVVSPWFRRVLRGTPGSTTGFFTWAVVVAAWMSLGPTMYANRRAVGRGLYYLFYQWVPAFNGLRVPSLNFMIVAFFLALLAGLGAASLTTQHGRRGRMLVALGMLAIVAESWSRSAPVTPPEAGPVYAAIRDLPSGAAIAEFPFGDVGAEIRYTYFAGFHRKPIVNGYSGFFPKRYVALVGWFSRTPLGAEAWNALLDAGATHAVVHEAAYADRGAAMKDWLRRNGARETNAFEADRLFELPRLRP